MVESASGPAAPPAAWSTAVGRQRPASSFEDLLGGRVLAWVGGVAVLLGVVFLLSVAVSRGWIGEEARTVMAGAVSLGLVLLGVRLYERRGRTEAALAAAAAGIAGLFATVTVATQVYDLVPALAGLIAAVGVGATATALAIRWRAQGIAALGIVGALLAPVLTDAPSELGTVAVLLAAAASATAVLLWQRWSWLGFATFLLAAPQWIAFLLTGEPAAAVAIVVAAAFCALNVAAAAGFELRTSESRLRLPSAVLLALNAFTCAAAGWLALDDVASRAVADGWLVGLAAAHLTAGLVAPRVRRVSHELGLVAQGLGVILADVAIAQLVSGLPLVLGWAGGMVAFAAFARHAGGRGDQAFAALGLGGHTALALGHALAEDAPASSLGGSGDLPVALLALGAVAAGCFVSARLAEEGHPDWRAALDVLGLAVLAYLWATALDGTALVLAWAGQAAALAAVARRAGEPAARHGAAPDSRAGDVAARGADPIATGGALAFLGGALGYAVIALAPPEALVIGLGDVAPALVALGGVAAATALAAVWLPSLDPVQRPGLAGLTGVIVLYAVSCTLVTPFQPGADTVALPLAELGIRQQGQALLSTLWALAGVGALVVGLARDLRAIRLAGLALLALTVGKVFLFDLAALTSLYRVASFVALGLLLLSGAFAWQRMRPRPLPDLRGMPEGLR